MNSDGRLTINKHAPETWELAAVNCRRGTEFRRFVDLAVSSIAAVSLVYTQTVHGLAVRTFWHSNLGVYCLQKRLTYGADNCSGAERLAAMSRLLLHADTSDWTATPCWTSCYTRLTYPLRTLYTRSWFLPSPTHFIHICRIVALNFARDDPNIWRSNLWRRNTTRSSKLSYCRDNARCGWCWF